ncbi:MAG: 6-phospho-3-hexuloisomerase [Candidatus Methanomethyliaceae archaeon]|nr:6-phospho-3-hexuloisomerase [Candidatus Methanomethyliaceae archaeon]MDW7970687.1 6-phospho-3-hexuloisomerase [Nitrososphaerota archaeon]
MSYIVKQFMREIANYVLYASSIINDSEIDVFVRVLLDVLKHNKKVLVVGAGRSGLAGRAFAMRLMHLGFNVFVFGETISPALGDGDLVIAISGSGTTRVVLTIASAAKEVRARVIAITSHKDSPLAKIADNVVLVPGRTKLACENDYNVRQILGEHEPLAPLGTLFEITLNVFLDSLIAELMRCLGKTEEDLKIRHSTIE